MRGLRRRKGSAEGSSRCRRSLVKKRKSSLYSSRIELRERESRKVGDLYSGSFLEGVPAGLRINKGQAVSSVALPHRAEKHALKIYACSVCCRTHVFLAAPISLLEITAQVFMAMLVATKTRIEWRTARTL